MRSRILTYTATIAALVLAMYGCGGSGDQGLDDEYNGPTSTVIIAGSSASDGSMVDETGGLMFDDSTQVVGTGGGVDGIDSIYDQYTHTCQFSFDPYSHSNSIKVVSNINDCDYDNRCVVCTAAQDGDDCSINCVGTVPSNAATAADYVTIYLDFTHEFLTNMPQVFDDNGTASYYTDDVGGIMHFWLSSIPWPEFNLTQPDIMSLDGCDGGDDMTWTVFDEEYSADSGVATMHLTALDPTPSSGSGRCMITHSLSANMYFTGAATPGATVDLTRGIVSVQGQICDEAENCPDI